MHWNEIGEIWFTLRTSGTSFKSPFWDDFFREYEQLLAMALLSLRQSPPESIFQLLNLILSFPEVINLLWMIIPSIRKPMVFLSMEKKFLPMNCSMALTKKNVVEILDRNGWPPWSGKLLGNELQQENHGRVPTVFSGASSLWRAAGLCVSFFFRLTSEKWRLEKIDKNSGSLGGDFNHLSFVIVILLFQQSWKWKNAFLGY